MYFNLKIILINIGILIVGCGSVEETASPNNTQEENNIPELNTDNTEFLSPFQKNQEVYDGQAIDIGTFYSTDINY